MGITKTLVIAAFLCGVLIANPALADDCKPLTQVTSVPMWAIDRDTRIKVPVSINGHSMDLAFDTGAVSTTLLGGVAVNLKLPISEAPTHVYDLSGAVTNSRAYVETFQIGTLGFGKGFFYVTRPTSMTKDGSGKDFNGILAASTLAEYDIDLDFETMTLTLFSPDHCPGKTAYWAASDIVAVPFELRGTHIILPITVDGQNFDGLIDTGAAKTSFLNGRMSNTFQSGHIFSTLSFSGVDVNNPDIQIGKGLTREPYVLIGMNVLKRMHVYISYREKKLYLSSASMPLSANSNTILPNSPKPELQWLTDAKTGCKIAAYPPRPSRTVIWSGACDNGFAMGYGVAQILENGRPWARYEGGFQKGFLVGRGTGIYASGDKYVGEFIDGLKAGHGSYTRPNGYQYVGGWKDNKPDGLGTETNRNGTKVTGEWKNGVLLRTPTSTPVGNPLEASPAGPPSSQVSAPPTARPITTQVSSAAPYDHANFRPAKAAAEAQINACFNMAAPLIAEHKGADKELGEKVLQAQIECLSTAERGFAIGIKLERKDLTEAYITKLTAIFSKVKSPHSEPPGEAITAEWVAARRAYLLSILALDGWDGH